MVIKVLAIFLYLTANGVQLEQIPTASPAECMEKGGARFEQLMLDPRVEDVLFGACIEAPVQEAKK